MIYTDPKTNYSVLDLGFDKLLVKISPVQDIADVPPELANVFTSGVASKNLLAGQLLEFIDTGQAGVSGLGDLGSDIRFWAGDTFENRASAPFRVDQDGIIYGTGAIMSGAITTGVGSSIDGQYLSSLSVATGALANLAVTAAKIDNATITATQIANATITTTQISGTAGITGGQIASATITGTNIGSATITATNIANATITSTQISGTAGITGGQIASATITATNIANATITATQISGTAGITGSQIASATITSANISATAGITGAQIASATITGSNISSATITATNITSLTITASEIANLTITGGKVAANTVTSGKLSIPVFILSAGTFTNNSPGAGSVAWTGASIDYSGTTNTITNNNTASKYIVWDSGTPTVFSGAASPPTAATSWLVGINTSGTYTSVWDMPQINGQQIMDSSVGGTQIASATIQAANIANGVITTTQISNTAGITGTQIANSTIAATNIANATITTTQISGTAGIVGGQIANNTITATQIANATITATQIANATITGTQIANATITGTQIAATTITASNITALTITANEIANATITTGKIVSLNIDKLNAGTITSKAITLAVAAGTGDTYIATGKTDFTNTDSGFILGIDDSDSDKPKFYIGDSTNYLNWDGTDFVYTGASRTTIKIQTMFESLATRFGVAVSASGSATSTYYGLYLRASTTNTANNYAWVYIANAITAAPFSSSMFSVSLAYVDSGAVEAGNNGALFVGIGNVVGNGTTMAFTGASINQYGFKVLKVDGVKTLWATSNSGNNEETTNLGAFTNAYLTAVYLNGKIKYYKNNALVATHTTYLPSGSMISDGGFGEFVINNSNTAYANDVYVSSYNLEVISGFR